MVFVIYFNSSVFVFFFFITKKLYKPLHHLHLDAGYSEGTVDAPILLTSDRTYQLG